MTKMNVVRVFVELAFKKSARSEHCRRFRREECPGRENLVDFLASGDVGRLQDVRFRKAVMSSMAYRAIYVTEAGRLGLCVPHAEPGDEIWGINGSRVPLVLRPLHLDGALERFNMIGDCLLQGSMDGELVPAGGRARRLRLV
ncbi:hypothetical protein F5X68DRAFT_204914 [Plectosphaerella plurivora]|uniref:Uncharacterized protein n=1 Tax=Plectosphaerella plurivora TaxID=936078 RepID=A0A9P8VF17_9PEZI|nr:hypothetical protein F5X68DRAFT_204914 [Plectosphaerella plurivora]